RPAQARHPGRSATRYDVPRHVKHALERRRRLVQIVNIDARPLYRASITQVPKVHYIPSTVSYITATTLPHRHGNESSTAGPNNYIVDMPSCRIGGLGSRVNGC